MLKGVGTFWSVHFFCLLLQPFHIIYNMVETLVVSLVIIAAGMLLLLVKVLSRKNGTFSSQHIHDSKAMKERGIHCVMDQDREMRRKGQCTPVECKATTGNVKSMRTVMSHPEKYHVTSAIKLGDYNIGRKDQLLTLPMYMAFLLKEV